MNPPETLYQKKTWDVLIIDDDALICEVSRLVLERNGCKVWLATNGAGAINIYKQQQEKIDMAIVDYDLPDMQGLEVCDLLRSINPRLKLVGISGFISPFNDDQTLLHSSLNAILLKPFTSEQLNQTVRRVMLGEG